ncbi:MAG: dTDP-4-dehydrorhamnose reductase [Acidimicrobiia bacterium]|nr:MAG: dTDP-4-dehydrorhamnose reductase [Acidimicrobiia bacterium]
MIVVTGGSGQLGTAFRSLLPDAAFPERDLVDLSDPDDLPERLAALHPTVLINCAAYNAVDQAESEPQLAMTINGTAVGVMARFAAEAGIAFVTFSSDYVFDGEADEPYLESSPTAPINAYGRSKEEGERAAREANAGALVVRTSWVLSRTHESFLTRVLRLAAGPGAEVVSDRWGCPTLADDLAEASLAAMNAGATGILHLTNTGPTTWFDLAREAAALAGLREGVVTPVPAHRRVEPARRPRYGVLGSERVEPLGLTPVPPWRERLPEVISALRRAGLLEP